MTSGRCRVGDIGRLKIAGNSVTRDMCQHVPQHAGSEANLIG